MSTIRRLCGPLAVAAAMALLRGAAFGAGDVPAHGAWKPPRERPPARKVLDDDEYRTRFRRAVAKINIAELERCREPAYAIGIKGVVEGSLAEAMGLKKGQLIVEVEGKPVRFPYQLRSRERARPYSILLHHKSGERERITVRPGRIGIYMYCHRRPELEYIQGRTRDKRWDAEVLVALLNERDDPELAETAWYHAYGKGYRPEALSDESRSRIAGSFARLDEAAGLAWFSCQAEPGRPWATLQLAEMHFATCDIDAGLALLRRHRQLVVNDLRAVTALAEEWRRRLREKGRVLPPIRQAEGRPLESVLERAEPANGMSEFYLQYLAKGGAHLSPPRTKRIGVVYGPTAANVAQEIQFRLRAKPMEKYLGYIMVGWADRDTGLWDEVVKCPHFHGGFGVEIDDASRVEVLHDLGDMRYSRTFVDLDLTGEVANTLRMAVCDGLCEVVLNGHRIYLAPFPSRTRRLAPMIKVNSMDLRVDGYEVFTIGEPLAPMEEEVELEEGEEIF